MARSRPIHCPFDLTLLMGLYYVPAATCHVENIKKRVREAFNRIIFTRCFIEDGGFVSKEGWNAFAAQRWSFWTCCSCLLFTCLFIFFIFTQLCYCYISFTFEIMLIKLCCLLLTICGLLYFYINKLANI